MDGGVEERGEGDVAGVGREEGVALRSLSAKGGGADVGAVVGAVEDDDARRGPSWAWRTRRGWPSWSAVEAGAQRGPRVAVEALRVAQPARGLDVGLVEDDHEVDVAAVRAGEAAEAAGGQGEDDEGGRAPHGGAMGGAAVVRRA